MTDHSVSLVANLITLFLALAIGTRMGYAVAARGTVHQIELMDRHFDGSRELFERQQVLQRETDLRMRSREELRSSYEVLGLWLHQMGQTLDEIHFGASSDEKQMRDKAEALVSRRPWEVVSPPAGAASAEFYWSADVLRKIRELQQPYAKFIMHTRLAMREPGLDLALSSSHVDDDAWEHWTELHRLIVGIKNQAREDLMSTSPAQQRA
ncbi:hypothetical protein [Streptomyces arenae]|uniref:hypothetical protein n=1 Tax=Streptomyces arenae TaxID=29301 RepID=UPI0026593C74|nr:hypothetical protein [Streptomyces arenae]MCG7204470.1 hypothetical protein [Streptomyces arenae]